MPLPCFASPPRQAHGRGGIRRVGGGGVWNARGAGGVGEGHGRQCVSPSSHFSACCREAGPGHIPGGLGPIVWLPGWVLGSGPLRAAPSRRPSGSLRVRLGQSKTVSPEKMVVSSLANPGVAMPSACRSMGLGWELVRSANAYISAAQASSIRPRTEAARNGSSRYILGRKQQHSQTSSRIPCSTCSLPLV